MTDEVMNYEERVNTDKLEFYFNEKVLAHINLKKEMSNGKKIFINGLIVRNPSKKVWIVKDRILGEIRVHVSEIVPFGVSKFTEVANE